MIAKAIILKYANKILIALAIKILFACLIISLNM